MVIMSTAENKKGFSGLINMGNTSYLNAVWQCLANDLDFTVKLLAIDTNKYLGNDYSDLLSCFQKLIDGMWRENRIIRPTSMKRSLNFNFAQYADPKTYHDANKFFYEFLEALRISTAERYVSVDVLNVSSTHYKASVKEWRSVLKDKKSFISDHFYGQYRKKFTCVVCGKVEFSYQLFSSMVLSIGTKPEENVNSLLNLHFKDDVVQMKCSCNGDTVDSEIEDNEEGGVVDNTAWGGRGKEEHSVSIWITRLPETLVITLDRFNDNNPRSATPIEIAENLDFSDYVISNSNESVKYSLTSILCHRGGNLDHGHYYSFIVRNGGYIFNDDKVYKFPFEKLNSTEPYMLFYKKLGSKKDT